MKNLKIGIFGLGCVGQGLYDVLNLTKGLNAEIVRICVKDPNKERKVPAELITYNMDDIICNDEIDVVVELVDTAEDALEIVTKAIKNGKAIVTANKKLVAEHFEEIERLQQEYNVPVLYEGACCASIPVIRNLEEYYDNDMIRAIEGIFNGSTNYILTKIYNEGKPYEEVLKEAQELGYAETDPTLDVEGHDPKYKLSIILNHAFGISNEPEDLVNIGISKISEKDVRLAKEKGYKIKLVASARKTDEGKVTAIVAPRFVDSDNPLYAVDDVYNAVVIEGAFSEKQLFVGKGAGSYPTGSAVLSDISALTHEYKYEYKKKQQRLGLNLTEDSSFRVYVSGENLNGNVTPLFSKIEEEHRSAEHNYLVGEMGFDALKQLREVEGVSAILV